MVPGGALYLAPWAHGKDGVGTGCKNGEASWLLPALAPAQLVFHAHFCQSPPGVYPNTELPGRALISRKGTTLLGCPARNKPSQAIRLGRTGRCLFHAPHVPVAPYPGTAPPRVMVHAQERLLPLRRLPTWGTCREMPGSGDFAASPAPFPAREGAAAEPPLPSAQARMPPPGAAEAHGSQWAPRRWAGWRLSSSRGRERADWERASCRRARVVGVEPREEEEEPPSSNPRTTASPGCGGPTPALYACRPSPRPPA